MLKRVTVWLLCLLFVGAGLYGESLANSSEIRYKAEIAPYVDSLKKHTQNPVDYVMGLFEKYDMVILCERAHAEKTQYDFIYDLVSDKRFIQKVGNIFTEIGSSTMNGYLHDFLFAKDLHEREVENRLLYIYRNFDYGTIWEKRNPYGFLKQLYALNNSLPTCSKVNFYFSDVPFNWEGMTKEKYKQLWDGPVMNRDRIMADYVINKFAEIAKSQQPRKKTLVIMNYRHAFNDFKYADGRKGDNTGRYIFEVLPGKVANVLLNSLLTTYNEDKLSYFPINNGKWDAAFEVVGNPSRGFDFKDTPFGADPFDLFPYVKIDATYQEVFTGFIFYRPLKEHIMWWGIPKFFADGFDKIILERAAIGGYPFTPNESAKFIEENGRVFEDTYEQRSVNYNDMISQIDQWLLSVKSDKPTLFN